MSQSSILISNDNAGRADFKIARGYAFDFYFEFIDEDYNDAPIDLLAADFTMIVKSQVTGEVLMTIHNEEWDRPVMNVVAKSFNRFEQLPVNNYPYAYKLDAAFGDGRQHPILKGNIKVTL